jgi:Xylose isomerase-like TIM barrel.
LCDYLLKNGIEALDMVDTTKWSVIHAMGLRVIVADGADLGVERGFCNKKWHKELQERYINLIRKMKQYGIKQLVCYAGTTNSLSDEEAINNCVSGLLPILKIAEENDVILTMKMLCSKDNDAPFLKSAFVNYKCDNIEWGAKLCDALNSPNFKLTYDLGHMTNQGRDVVRDIKQYISYISHFQLSEFRHKKLSEKKTRSIIKSYMQAIRKCNYSGYIAIQPDRIEKNIDANISKWVHYIDQ